MTVEPSQKVLTSSRRKFSGETVIGIALLLLALLFYWMAVLRIDLHRTSFLDLGPYPDAVEYFGQANSILRHGQPTIQIGYDRLPSRYPPGYPTLMLPWLSCLPHHSIYAPFRTNQTIGLLLLLGFFFLYLGYEKPLAGGVATLLLASQPAFITYSRASMSDLSGAAAAVLAFALVYSGLTSRRRWLLYAAAVVLGLSLSIRPQLLFFGPLLISMALFPGFRSRWHWLLHCVSILLAFLLAASPYFLLNWSEFGHPLRTGYDFWVPSLTDRQMPFSLHNLPRQFAMLWQEASATRTQFRVSNLFGTGTYFVPGFVLLSLLGLAFCRFTRFTFSALLAGMTFFVATTTYSFVDGRFFMPLQFLLVPIATLPVLWVLRGGQTFRRRLFSLSILLLYLFSCAGYPSQSAFPPKANRIQAWDALQGLGTRGRSPRYQAVIEFRRAFSAHPGVVFSNIDPVYLNALLPSHFVAAPIDEKHSYAFSRLWHYGKSEATALLENEISLHHPVYALRVPPTNPAKNSGPLPDVAGYSWQRNAISHPGLEVMTLVSNPNSSGPPPPALHRP